MMYHFYFSSYLKVLVFGLGNFTEYQEFGLPLPSIVVVGCAFCVVIETVGGGAVLDNVVAIVVVVVVVVGI
jgi:hypothetical protein